MRRKLLEALLCTATITCLAAPELRAQADSPIAAAQEVPQATYRLKKVTVTFFGGRFSGGTFLDLPRIGPRTQVEEGSDDVIQYSGLPFTNGEYLPSIKKYYNKATFFAPQKKIEPGTMFGARVGFYFSDAFHVDLRLARAASKATTSFLYDNPADPKQPTPIRYEDVDVDNGYRAFLLGADMTYDAHGLSIFGVSPYIGCGFGAIINRFSHLQDKSALYFKFAGGLAHDFGKKLRLSVDYSATLFNFAREELTYGKQVTYGTATVSVSYLIDMVPRD